MNKPIRSLLAATLAAGIAIPSALAVNPLILDQFTADPSARVFEGTMYVYPSHDIRATPGKGRPGWFCMEDYHVFSSTNLTDWTDHGVIVTQTGVDWVNPDSYSMWAPDCVEKDGKYYFYFPATAKDGGFRIGVAVADRPYGPFVPRAQPIENVRGIDPCVFIDRDGEAYLYYSMNKIFVAKLKDNMVELDSEPQVIDNLPTQGLLEGPFVFEREGVYYLTYPHVENKTERLEYAIGAGPMGPFEPAGVIMDESPSGCWTIHQSMVEYQGQWVLFYHDNDLSPDFDKNRSIRADRLTFADDGRINKVIPTLRGVGIVDARSPIQIDRYSAVSAEGVAVSFLDEDDTHQGWKITLSAEHAWARFDQVDFGEPGPKVVAVQARAPMGGEVEIRIDGEDGPLLATVRFDAADDWRAGMATVSLAPTGIHDVVVRQTGDRAVDVDWIQFDPPDPDFYVFLCLGQSNMEGFPGIEEQDRGPVDPRFQMLAAVNFPQQDRVQGQWYPAAPPLSRAHAGIGPADFFGRTLVSRLPPDVKVGVVNVAVAGCKIELFDEDTFASYAATAPAWMANIIREYGGNPYAHLVKMAKQAQQDGVIRGVLLHQGESNTGDEEWPNKVKKVYDRLLQDLDLDPEEAPLLVGEVVHADQGGVCAPMNAIINTLPQTIPTAHVISSAGCAARGDRLHFSPAGYRALGTRYAETMLALLAGTSAAGEAADTSAGDTPALRLNEQDYFASRGFDVLAFENAYGGMFFDEKTSGIILVHHGVRTATGGAVRLKPTPEQWDQIPTVVERTVHEDTQQVDVLLRYADFDFDARVRVEPHGAGARILVSLDEPLPPELVGRTGFNLEFLPSAYFEKTFRMDDTAGILPRHPASAMTVRPAAEQLRQFAGHSTFDDRGRGEFVEPNPIAEGKMLILAPEDPERRMQIESVGDGDLRLLDGRAVAQNGWYVVRTLIPAGRTGTVVEWILTPTVLPEWTRKPVIGYSQAGYTPQQEKVAVMELDPNDELLGTAAVQRLDDQGEWVEAYQGEVVQWGEFYRYQYARFDFSAVREPGLYRIQYGDQLAGPILIGPDVYEDIWHPTLDVWFPVQMDHMFVNEAYRVWHGAAHLDDARQAPLNHQHFDGYRSGASTETPYQPGERIPGLNIGGWFDAGDFDIRTGSHCNTVLRLVESWEHFEPRRDQTLVDQPGRYVDLHHPDGTPDILQQIEHGALALIAQHRAFGRAIPGIIVPNLHQYHHLGDGSTMTDNLPYNPELAPYESDGVSSGTPDDRWAFTARSSAANLGSIAALAAASRALRGHDDALANECLLAAQKAWDDEQQQPSGGDSRRGGIGRGGEAALQLYAATRDAGYAEQFQELLWPSLERNLGRTIGLAVRALPLMDQAYRDRLAAFAGRYREENDELLTRNPYGVPITTGGWGGNGTVVDWASTAYLVHRAYPDLVGPEYAYRGLAFLLGCHPYSNTSFVSGVGLQSKTIAYGNNRADYSFIAGGVVPGNLFLRPDLLESKDDWPFLWGENEYVIDICASYIYLANAVRELGQATPQPPLAAP